MKLTSTLFTLSSLLTVNGLKCSNHEVLQNYQIAEYSTSGEITKNTPPSTTKESWWLNICEENKNNFDLPEECDKNDILCGITQVILPNEKDPFTSQIIDFNNRLALEIDSNEDDKMLYVNIKSNKWGSYNIDANIEWSCDTNLKTDEITDSLWFENEINISIKGPSACLKNDGDNNKNKKPSNDDSNNNTEKDSNKKKNNGMSWFTWLFIYALLFTFFYLLITSYMNTRGGDLNDFRQEFIDRCTQLFISLPGFCKEVVTKIMGSRSTSERGGYSAV